MGHIIRDTRNVSKLRRQRCDLEMSIFKKLKKIGKKIVENKELIKPFTPEPVDMALDLADKAIETGKEVKERSEKDKK
jgi:hypothetical protein